MNRFLVYRWIDAPWLAGLAFFYALLAGIVATHLTGNANVSLVWLPGGLAMSALLLGGRKYWLGVFIGAFAAYVMLGRPVPASILMALSNTLEPLLCVWLLARFDPTVKHPRDYSFFWMGVASAISASVSALIGVTALSKAGGLTLQTFPNSLLHWWMGDMLGILLVTPFVLAWQKIPHYWFEKRRIVETVACFGFAFLCGQAVFLDWFDDSVGQVARGYWMFLPVTWGAVRFGNRGTFLIVGMTAVQALLGAVKGIGFFDTDIARTHLTNFWFYMVTLAVVGMALALVISKRKLAEDALNEEKEKLRAIFEGSNDAIMLLTEKGFFDCNIRTLALFGLGDKEEFTAHHPADLSPPFQPDGRDSFSAASEKIKFALEHGMSGFEWMHRRKSGEDFPAEVLLSAFNYGGEQVLQATVRDISERKKTEESLRLAATVFNTVDDAVMVTDADNRIIMVNPSFSRITGYSPDEVTGRNPRILSSGKHPRGFYQAMRESLAVNGEWSGEITNRRKSGGPYIEWLSIKRVCNEKGITTHHVAVFSDITLRKAEEEKVQFLAHHDALTGLPNRTLFGDRLQQALATARRNNAHLALLFLDLDGFKPINDSYGHDAGDAVLKIVAQRLLDCVRGVDTVARLGGDEFAIILGELENPGEASIVAGKILQAIAQPMVLAENSQCVIGTSIGISTYPENGDGADSLLAAADVAMYDSKRGGKSRFTYFSGQPIVSDDNKPWIVFDSSHYVGVEEVDEEHRELVRLVNTLNDLRKNKAPQEAVAQAFDNLISHTLHHFATEERLMEQHGYRGIDGHKLAHKRLVDEVIFFKTRAHQGIELLTLQAVKDWLFRHIEHEDKAMGAYLVKRGVK